MATGKLKLTENAGRIQYQLVKEAGNNIIPITTLPEGLFDGFSRLRVSEVTTQLDAKQLYDKLPLLFDEELGGTATSTHDPNTASTELAVLVDGDYVVRQSFQRFNYQSGKSQQIFLTGSGFESPLNVNKRMGYFRSSNISPYSTVLDGIYLESENGTVSARVSRNGTLVDNTNQADFNLDTLDGSGPSGVTVDWNKDFIYMITFEWLGVGDVLHSLVIGNTVINFHIDNHANILEDVYMKSPNQPIRYEIRSTGGANTFKTICSAVGSEGSLNKIGIVRSANTLNTALVAATQGTLYALLGLRLQLSKSDNLVDFLKVNVIGVSANRDFLWQVYLNPTVAGTFTYVDETNSTVSVAKGVDTNTVTGGTLIDSGYVAGQSSDVQSIDSSIKLGVSIAGVLDEIVLTVTPIGASNVSVYGGITWRE